MTKSYIVHGKIALHKFIFFQQKIVHIVYKVFLLDNNDFVYENIKSQMTPCHILLQIALLQMALMSLMSINVICNYKLNKSLFIKCFERISVICRLLLGFLFIVYKQKS